MHADGETSKSPYRAIGISEWLARNWLLILACMPVIRVLLLTSFDGEFASWQFSARVFWIPSLVLEMFVFLISVLNGLNISRLLEKLPRMAKVLLSLWFLSLLVSTFLADTVPIAAYRGAAFWFVHLLFLAAVAHLIDVRGTARILPSLELFVLVLATASAFTGLCLFIFVMTMGIHSTFDWSIHLPGYANLRHTGYFFAPAMALSLAHLAARPSRFANTHLLLFTANTAFMLWLGSRGPVFGMMAGLTVGAIFFTQMRTVVFWKKTTAGLGFASVLSIIMPIPLYTGFGAIQRFWEVKLSGGGFTSGRVEFWLESIDLILKKPLFGYGTHQYQYASEYAAGIFKHPHNSIIQFIFDWGFIGGGLFLCLLAYAAYFVFFRISSTLYVRLVSAVGLATLFAYSMVDGILFYPYTVALFIVLLLLPLSEGKKIDARD